MRSGKTFVAQSGIRAEQPARRRSRSTDRRRELSIAIRFGQARYHLHVLTERREAIAREMTYLKTYVTEDLQHEKDGGEGAGGRFESDPIDGVRGTASGPTHAESRA